MIGRVIHTPTETLICKSLELETVNVTLYGKKDFADVIKVKDLEMERLSWIIRVGLQIT